MSVMRRECPNCGKSLLLSSDGKTGFCPACDSQYVIEDNVIKHRMEGSITIEGLTTKGQLLKRAEQHMQERQYADAVALYHEVIDHHDAHCSLAWWGLCRASVKDFTDITQSITRASLGKHYEKAIEYATSDQRSAIEAVIRQHEEKNKHFIAERDARERVHQKQMQAEAEQQKAKRLQAEQEAALLREKQQEAQRLAAAERRIKNRRRFKSFSKAAVVVLFLFLILFAINAWVLAPKNRYQSAVVLYEKGRFQEARAQFLTMPDYSNSREYILLCDAYVALETDDIDTAMDLIIQHAQLEKTSIADDDVRKRLLGYIENWEESGMTAPKLLALLDRVPDIDQQGIIDQALLKKEAYLHLASTAQKPLAHAFVNIDHDGNEELLTLSPSVLVQAWKLNPTGISEHTLNAQEQYHWLREFGLSAMDQDMDLAIQCFEKVYAHHVNTESKETLSGAYYRRSEKRFLTNQLSFALEDAKKAYDIHETEQNYQQYFMLAQKITEGMKPWDAAINHWASFSKSERFAIERYSLSDDAETFAGMLHLSYAKQLSSEQNPQAKSQFLMAEEHGIPVLDELLSAASLLGEGVEKIALLDMAYQRSIDHEPEVSDTISKQIRSDLIASIADWEKLGIPPQHVFTLFDYAESYQLKHREIDYLNQYQKAALTIAKQKHKVLNHSFVPGQRADQPDLILFNEKKQLVYYALSEQFSEVDTLLLKQFSAPMFHAFHVPHMNRFIVYEEGKQGSSFVIIEQKNNRLTLLLAEQEAHRLTMDDAAVTFSMLLPGSIERFVTNRVDIADPACQPLEGSIDWRSEQYPYPTQPNELIQRFFEAHAYGVDEEVAMLIAQSSSGVFPPWFAHAPRQLPKPDNPMAVRFAPYLKIGDAAYLFEVSYPYKGNELRKYIAVSKEKERWRIAAVSDVYHDPAFVDSHLEGILSGELLCLNEVYAMEETKEKKATSYRMLISTPAELQIDWMQGAATVHVSGMIPDTGFIASYQLTNALTKTNPIYLMPGEYRMTVESTSAEKASFTVLSRENKLIECEPNDDADHATLLTDEQRSGSLQHPHDVDIYRLSLEEAGSLALSLEQAETAEDTGTVYKAKLQTADGSKTLYRFTLAGNQASFATDTLYLDQGDYLLQLEAGEVWTDRGYRVSRGYQANASGEREPNDRPETAAPLSLDAPVNGIFSTEDDRDCYSFELDSPTLLQVQVSSQEEAPSAFELSIDNDKAQPLWSGQLLKGEQAGHSPSLALQAGRYTLALKHGRGKIASYALLVKNLQGAVAPDNNDVPETAAPLEPGIPMHASSLALDEAPGSHYFTFRTDQPGGLSLSFTNLNHAFESPSYHMALFDAATGNMIQEGDMEGTVQAFALPTVLVSDAACLVRVTTSQTDIPGTYSLNFTLVPQEDGEQEWNDSPERAAPLGDTPRSGSLQHPHDVDIYRLSLEEAGSLALSLEQAGTTEDTGTVYKAKLQTADGSKTLYRFTLAGNQASFATDTLYLDQGDYLLWLEAGEGWTDRGYRVSRSYQANASGEREPNDRPETATPLSLDTSVNGIFSTGDDRDCYSFELASPTLLQVQVSSQEEAPAAFELSIDNDKAQPLWSGQLLKGEQADHSPSLALQAGRYTLALKHGRGKIASYALLVKNLQGAVAPDNNDVPETAAPLEPGIPMHASSLALDEAPGSHYFTFRTDQPGGLSLSFANLNHAFLSPSYHMALFDAATGNMIQEGDMEGTEEAFTLPTVLVSDAAYLVRVTTSQADIPGTYSLSFTLVPQEDGEQEWNDSPERAAPLGDTPRSGSLQHPHDVDIYRLSLEEAGSLALSLEQAGTTEDTGTVYKAKLQTADGSKTIYRFTLAGNQASFATDTLYLDQGDYLLQLEAGEVWTDRGYRVSRGYQANASGEREPNDRPETAAPLSLDTPVNGIFSTGDDRDCYSFELASPTLLQVQVSSQEEAPAAFELSIDNDKAHPLWSGQLLKGEQAGHSPSLALQAGRYTLALQHGRGEIVSYALLVKNLQGAVAPDNNDVPETAAPLEPGIPVYASSLPLGEAPSPHYFTFRTDQPGGLSLSFTNLNHAFESPSYHMALFEAATGNMIQEGDMEGTEEAFILPTVLVSDAAYLVRVTTSQADIPGTYSLSFTLVPQEDGEQEWNDSPERAAPLGDTPRSGSLQHPHDVDIYRLSLEEAGSLVLNLEQAETTEDTGTVYKAKLQTADGSKTIYRFTLAGNQASFATDTLYLDQGDYLLWLEAGEGWTDRGYRVSRSYQANASGEREPNDRPETAAPLSLDAPVNGIFSTEDDRDYYSFELASPTLLQVALSHAPMQIKETILTAQLYRAGVKQQLLWEDALQGTLPTIASPALVLQAGAYFLYVENNAQIIHPYQLNINTIEAIHVEKEENDAIEQANRLPLGRAFYGSSIGLNDRADIDNYAFTLPGPGRVSITCALLPGYPQASAFDIVLADRATLKPIYTFELSGNHGTITTPELCLGTREQILQVTAQASGEPWYGAYSIHVSYEADENTEQEYNDEKACASPLPLNQPVRGQFHRNGDMDCYLIELDQDALLSLKITNIQSRNTAYTLRLTRAPDDKHILWEEQIDRKTDSLQSPPIALNKGRYLLSFGSRFRQDQPYWLHLMARTVEKAEAEPNDTAAQATQLSSGERITGVISKKADQDWYRFTVEEESSCRLGLLFDRQENSSDSFTLQLEQHGKEVLAKKIPLNKGEYSSDIRFPKGSYFIRVGTDSRKELPYTLTLHHLD